MHVTAPRFDWSFNFGHVLTSLSMLSAVGGAVLWTSGKIADFEYRIKAGEIRAQTYIPIVTGLVKSDDVQNERIGNLSDAIKGIRTDIAENARQYRIELQEINKNTSSLRENMAAMNARQKNEVR